MTDETVSTEEYAALVKAGRRTSDEDAKRAGEQLQAHLDAMDARETP